MISIVKFKDGVFECGAELPKLELYGSGNPKTCSDNGENRTSYKVVNY